ncbi:methyltransferase GliN [Ophiobolus disseminans]|uniref:Methyltransferase GliN n=1 Tax=Ophiobolus disseminans TaxID=1469910 RepID=A0A6A7AD04_9PLEO|nr:methyltransferase GliN [Ophiobolus disseminans]
MAIWTVATVVAHKTLTLWRALYKIYLESKKRRQEAEFHRYRVQHDLHKSEFGESMIVVPVAKDAPARILDSATGEGIWMIEELANYLQATFVGTDVEPAGFGEHPDLPVSISFHQQSILDAWPETEKGSFDLVHQRYGFTNIPVEQCQTTLVYADLLGFESGDGHEGMVAMTNFMSRFFKQRNMDPSSGPRLRSWLKAAGAENVEVTAMSFGVGKQATTEELAEKSSWNILTLIDNFSFVCSNLHGFWYTQENFKKLIEDVKKELETTGNRWQFCVATGQRSSTF